MSHPIISSEPNEILQANESKVTEKCPLFFAENLLIAVDKRLSTKMKTISFY